MADLTIPYAHAWDTVKKGIDDKGPYYTLSYWFDDWSQSDDVANQLTGYTARTGDGTKRVPPHQFPLSPNLFCTGVVIEGIGTPILNSDGKVNYNGGFFAHVEYRSSSMIVQQTQQDPDNDHQVDKDNPIVWCTQELDFEVETYVFEKSRYHWVTTDSLNNQFVKIPFKVNVGVTTINLTFHEVPYLPIDLIRKKRMQVNNAKFLGAPVGCILFVGARTIREINRDGTLVQKVQYQFKDRDIPWNQFLRSDKKAWAEIQDSASNTMFATTDLSPLVRI